MKRTVLMPLLLLLLVPMASTAGFDNKTDSFGVYFDVNGNTNATTWPMFTPSTAYLLLMNPAGPTDGFECTVTPVGAPYFILATTLPANTLDIDASANGFACGAAAPFPTNAGGAMVLCTWSIMLQAQTTLDFFITKATQPSLPGNMPVVTGDGVLRLAQVASCDVTLPVATVNGGVPEICNDPNVPHALAVDITAQSGTVVDSAIRAGSAVGATDGQDLEMDTPKPAPPPAGYVHASFEHVGWSMGPRFARDLRAVFDPFIEYQVWPFMVETDRSGDVSLTFVPDFAQAEVMHLYLRDVATGQYHNLYPALSFVFTNNGLPSTRRFELICGAAPVPPALEPASRTLPAGWSMVGLPLTPVAGATVGSLMLDPAPGSAYAYDYVPGSSYRLLSATTAASATAGYWLATEPGFTWSAPGTRNIDGVTTPLVRGWNLVSYANWFVGPHEGLRVIHGATTYDWTTATQMGLVSGAVQDFDAASGSYVEAADLSPWRAYWVNALADGVSLHFYWGHFLELPTRLTTEKLRLDPDDDSWQSELLLVDASGQRRSIVIGRGTGATAGFDPAHDRPLPPQSPAGGPQLMFSRPEWDLASGPAMSRDIVGLDDPAVCWRIVASSQAPGRALLSWDPEDWPAGVDFQLYLPAENRVALMSMRGTTSYVLKLGTGAVELVVRTPDMTSGTDSPVVTATRLAITPNPFNPSTTISCDLPRAARAEVRIHSVRGELVAVIDGGARPAGPWRTDWAGTDRHGRIVPSGTYFARLYLDGASIGEVSRMSLVR